MPEGRVPIPDPTVLTTAQTDRLREEVQREFAAAGLLFDTKIDSIVAGAAKLEKRVDENHASMNVAVREIEIRIGEKLERVAEGVTALNEEKFAGIEKQFAERDVRTEQAAIATKIAVDAALQAQKEAANAQNESNAAAVAKSEAATVKQIDGISALLNSNVGALNDKISDLKGRLDRGEGSTGSQIRQRSDQRQDSSLMIAYAMMAIAVVAVLASVILPHLAN